jgi:hypothetical protein
MNSFYDDPVLQQAIQRFVSAKQCCTSDEMRLMCAGLVDLAFAINEIQKRLHFIEEKVGVSPLRAFEGLFGSEEANETRRNR